MLSISLCICWSFVYLLWKNIYSSSSLIFFLNGFFFFSLLLSCLSSFYILDINPLSDIQLANTFLFPFCILSFHFYFSFFFGCVHGMQKFQARGSPEPQQYQCQILRLPGNFLSFHFDNGLFSCTELFTLMWSYLFIFYFGTCVLGVITEKSLQKELYSYVFFFPLEVSLFQVLHSSL